jgi:hypothetical protein
VLRQRRFLPVTKRDLDAPQHRFAGAGPRDSSTDRQRCGYIGELEPGDIVLPMHAADPTEDAHRAVRAYVEAIGRRDFETACSYLCHAGRVLARAQAKADGLDTDDCAAALAYLAQRHSGDLPPPEAAVAAFNASLGEVDLVDPDHAIVRRNDSGEELPLVREDGAWKIGVMVGKAHAPQAVSRERRETPPSKHVRHRRPRKR